MTIVAEQMRQPGHQIGHYVVRSILGQGGMGEVYEAEDVRLGRRVALKLIPRGADAEARERMMREARAAAGFEHPNVVVVLDVGVVDESEGEGETYLAMELVRGCTLRSSIGDKSIPVGRRIRWLVDVARALAAGHAVGLVHRDIKPDNLMVREDGVIKVLDFGIAKRSKAVDPSAPTELSADFATLTKEGSIIGTPRYAAPEQLRGDPLDGRADQYAWAATGYEILSGKPPFDADGAIELLSRILTTDAAPLASIAQEVPAEVSQAIMRALSKRPEDRFPTLDEAADAIEPFAAAAFSSGERAAARSGTEGRSVPTTAKSQVAPPSVAVRAAKMSFRVFFWIAAAIGTLIIGVIAYGAATGNLVVNGPTRTTSASASASVPANTLTSTSIRCSDATVSGPGTSNELAHMFGIGACARVAIATGRAWGHDKAVEQGVDLSKSPSLSVSVELGPTSHVCLALGDLRAEADSTSPMEAMRTAVGALAKDIGMAPMSDAARDEWGATTVESAQRIERLWRDLLVGDLDDPEAEARALTKSDPESPWSHAILGIVALRGSKTCLDAVAAAEARLDKLSGTRKTALGAVLKLISKPDPNESMRELRQAYEASPNDADMAGLYAAIAISIVPSEEGFAVVDRLAERFPTRAILAIGNAVSSAPRRDVARDQRYLDRLVEIVPDAACDDAAVDQRLLKRDFEGARTLLATCGVYYGSASADRGLELKEARLALLAGEPEKAHDLAAKHLGDPRPAMRAEAAQYVVGSFLLAGRMAEAEDTLLAEFRRNRDAESILLAMRQADTLFRVHRRLGTKAPTEVVTWYEANLPKATFLSERAHTILEVELVLSKRDTRRSDEVLAGVERLDDQSVSLMALPLVRARKGDKAAVALVRAGTRASKGARLTSAIDGALALEASKADVAEIERALAPLQTPDAAGGFSLDSVIADVVLARVYGAAKQEQLAIEAKARVGRVLAHADPGLRETLEKLR